MSVPFLGRIPIDPRIVGCGDAGSCLLEAHPESPAAQSYFSLADRLHEQEDLWSGAAAAALASREALQ
jgi:nitrogenase subunit NifH